MSRRPPLLAVVGPTAVGKTPFSVELARRHGRAELLNADSRQVLRGLRAGTCAPGPGDLRGVRCHLLDLVEPGDRFTVADWARLALPIIDALQAQGSLPILVGGTGLYVSAAVDGYELAGGSPDPQRRRRRDAASETVTGLERLVAELLDRDPAAAAGVDLRNRRRVVRALELVDTLGSVAAARRASPRPALLIGIDAPRALHDALIDDRARRLFESGSLLEEVEAALARGLDRTALDRAGIGYREALAVRDGAMTVSAAIAEVVRRTRRYAKAQRTWFRRDRRIRWIVRDEDRVDALVEDALHIIASAVPLP